MLLVSFFFMFSIGRPECIQNPIDGSCIVCSPNYYDRTYEFSIDLGSKPECTVKTMTFNYTQKILITNQKNCQEEPLLTSDFGGCYSNISEAFRSESLNSLRYGFSSLTFFLSPGIHDLTSSTKEQFFRQINAEILILPLLESQKSEISIKSNRFYFFIAYVTKIGNLTVSANFLPNQLSSESFPEEDSFPGLFISEALFGTQETSLLLIQNCSFNEIGNSYPLLDGWTTIFHLGYKGNIFLESSTFKNIGIPLIYGGFKPYLGIFTDLIDQNFFIGSSMIIKNCSFEAFISFIQNTVGSIRIMESPKWKGSIQLSVLDSNFREFNGLQCLFCISNSGSVFFKNNKISDFGNATMIQGSGVQSLQVILLHVYNGSNMFSDIFYFQNSSNINFSEITIEKSIVQNIFSFENVGTLELINADFSNLETHQCLLSETSSQNITLKNLTFNSVSCGDSLFSIGNNALLNISNAFLFNLTIANSLFSIHDSSFFEISSFLIKNSSMINVYLMQNVNASSSFSLQIINNSLSNLYSKDHTCFYTLLNSSQIENNTFSGYLLILSMMNPIYFTMSSTFVNRNWFIDSFTMISMIVGFTELYDDVFVEAIFVNTVKYQYAFDFEIANILVISGCIFFDLGVFDKKNYYVSKDNNEMITLWNLRFSSICNSFFLVSERVDLSTGFIEASPHGGLFESVNCTFIILSVNPNFQYKGVYLDHTVSAWITGNKFEKLTCNPMNFLHAHGGIIITASSSLSYSLNSFSLYMKDNLFNHCICPKAGALAIIGISNVILINNSFYNSSAIDYAGHLLIVGGKKLNISGLNLKMSKAAKAGAFLLRNFLAVFIEKLIIEGSYSEKSANFEIKSIGFLDIFNSSASNLSSGMISGFMSISQTRARIVSSSIQKISAEGDGGAIYILGGSSLSIKQMNFSELRSNSGSGGVIFIANAKDIIIENVAITECRADFQGAALYVDLIETLRVENLTIFGTISKENGIIFVKTESETSIFSFTRLVCNCTEGACLYYISASQLIIDGLQIIGNLAMAIFIYWSFVIKITIINVNVESCNIKQSLFLFSGIELSAENWTFKNSTADCLIEGQELISEFKNVSIQNSSGSFAFFLELSSISVSFLNFLNNFPNPLSLISTTDSEVFFTQIFLSLVQAESLTTSFLLAFNSGLYIKDSQFIDNRGLIIRSFHGIVSLFNCFFSGNQHEILNSDQSSDLFIESSDILSIENSKFEVTCEFSIEGIGNNFINLTNSFFIGTQTEFTFAIRSTDSMKIIINNSRFQSFGNGGVKLVSSSSEETTDIVITSCNFTEISSAIGSALYFNGNFNISIFNSNFFNNRAKTVNSSKLTGVAACLFFKHLNDTISSISIEKTTFQNNLAEFIAPTIFSQIFVKSLSNQLGNNSDQSGQYNEFFSYPLNLLILNSSNTSIASGQSFTLEIQLVDLFGRQLTLDNKTFLIIKTKQGTSENKAIEIQNSLVQGKSGIFSFKNLIIKTSPNSTIILTISGLFAGIVDPSNLNSVTISSELKFLVRSCLVGEIIASDSSCYFCLQGTYSFFDPMITEIKYQKCNACPSNCFCYGGKYVVPMPGYYRKSNFSENAVECENPAACLGSPLEFFNNSNFANLSYYAQGQCLLGNIDTLCFYCDYNYGKYERTDFCQQCASLGFFVFFRLFFYVFILIVYILLNFHIAENSHKERKNPYANIGTFFKIIVNHSQHITIIMATTDHFPFPSLGKAFYLSDYLSFSNDHVVTNDCLIQRMYYNKEMMIVFKEIFNTILPILFSLLSCFVWIFLVLFINNINYCVRFRQKLPTNLKALLHKILLFMVFCTFIFYSLIVKSCFGLFNCRKIDEKDSKTYLRESPNLSCWETDHLRYIFLFGLPALIIWGVIFPVILFFVLRRNAKIVDFAEKTGLSNFRSSIVSSKKMHPSRSSKVAEFPTNNMNKYLANDAIQGNDKIWQDNREKQSIKINITAETIQTDAHQMIEKLAASEDNNDLRKFKSKNEKLKYLQHIVKNIEQSLLFVFFYKDFKQDYYYWECLIFFRKFILTFLSSMAQTIPLEIAMGLMLVIIFWFCLATMKVLPYKLRSASYLESFSLLVCQATIFSASLFQSETNMKLKEYFGVFCIALNLVYFGFAVLLMIMDAVKRYQEIRKTKTLSMNIYAIKDKRKKKKLNGKVLHFPGKSKK